MILRFSVLSLTFVKKLNVLNNCQVGNIYFGHSCSHGISNNTRINHLVFDVQFQALPNAIPSMLNTFILHGITSIPITLTNKQDLNPSIFAPTWFYVQQHKIMQKGWFERTNLKLFNYGICLRTKIKIVDLKLMPICFQFSRNYT